MPVLKSEQRASASAKTARKRTAVKTPAAAVNSSAPGDEDDGHSLRLFKHTPLPTTFDDDTTALNPTPNKLTTASSAHDADETEHSSEPAYQLTPADLNQLTSLYTAVRTTASSLHHAVRAYITSLPQQPSTAAGNSLYELKNKLLLAYLLRLVHVVRLRVSGQSIAEEPSVDEMNEIRVVLERIRPIEKRIKYSVDKLLAAPADASAAASKHDPLQYRPNPLDLLPVSGSAASASAPRKQPRMREAALSPPASPSASGVYQAPHHVPVLPSEARSGVRQPRVSAGRLRSLYAEVGDRPEERLVEGGGHGELGEASDEEEERREYEERMMVRLVDTKADKRRKRDREQRKALDNMDEYDELRQFVERRERTDRPDPTGEARRAGAREGGSGREKSSVDELFNGVERGEGPRKRAKTGGKKGKAGKGPKGRGGSKRR